MLENKTQEKIAEIFRKASLFMLTESFLIKELFV